MGVEDSELDLCSSPYAPIFRPNESDPAADWTRLLKASQRPPVPSGAWTVQIGPHGEIHSRRNSVSTLLLSTSLYLPFFSDAERLSSGTTTLCRRLARILCMPACASLTAIGS